MKIFNVKNFELVHDNFIAIVDSKLSFYKDNHIQEIKDNCISFTVVGNNVLFYDSEKHETIVWNSFDNNKKSINNFVSFKQKINNEQFLGLIGTKVKREVAIISNADFTPVIFIPPNIYEKGGLSILNENIFTISFENKIVSYSILKQTKLWEIDFQEKLNLHDPTIYKHVAYGGHLYVYINDDRNPDKSHVYSIDLETGEIVAEFPDFKGYVTVFDGLIYTTRQYEIQILDPSSQMLNTINLKQEMLDNGFKRIDPAQWTVEGKMFYFVQNVGDVQARVGIVDLSTQKVVDKIVLDRKNGSIGTIKVHNNRLYILSQDSTLHIYEVERKTSPTEPMY